MSTINDLLGMKDFWRYYQALDDADEVPEAVQRFFGLDDEFDGEESAQRALVTIRFECPASCAIELDVRADYWSQELSLTKEQKRFELGWWDQARWHPFALRWEELEKLTRYWIAHPKRCVVGADAALLLLSRFVGNGAEEKDELPRRQQTVANAYRKLGLFSVNEIKRLVKVTLVNPSEEDYRWQINAELGWVFGGEYPCYSLRNPEHSGGDEGRFPFDEWNRLIARLE